jgi:hypothetical protein
MYEGDRLCMPAAHETNHRYPGELWVVSVLFKTEFLFHSTFLTEIELQ